MFTELLSKTSVGLSSSQPIRSTRTWRRRRRHERLARVSLAS